MKPWVSVLLTAFSVLCVMQIVALYSWLPNKYKKDLNSCLSIENHISISSRETLGEKFKQLTKEGKNLGLSKAELVLLLDQALRESQNGEVQGFGSKKEESIPFRAGTVDQKVVESIVTYPWSNISNLINPHDYELVINQPNFCNKDGLNKTSVFLLVLMTSSPSNFKQRDIQRKSCMSLSQVYGRNFLSLFLLGDSGNEKISAKVVEESFKHGDILQENFQDSYINLTVKIQMGMKWVSMYCPQAEYILKTDDDVFVSLSNIVQLLEKAPRKNYYTGYVYTGTKPLREKKYKWYISEEQYPRSIFPPYCCGIGYILSGDLAPKIFTQSLTIPYIYLEDVFTGLCIEKLNIVPKVNPGFFVDKQDYDYCTFKRAYAVHVNKPIEMLKYWNNLAENTSNVTCKVRMEHLRHRRMFG